MAKARMLHNKISVSIQVNSLTTKAALLFTWMVSHADDDGRMLGEAKSIKARVVPMQQWPEKVVEELLVQITDKGLIYRWEKDGNYFIEFPTWSEYQKIQKDRYKKSQLPTYNENQPSLDTSRYQNVTKVYPQSNLSESSEMESNKSESNEKTIADFKTYKKDTTTNYETINPKTFTPTDRGSAAALDAWKALEPNNLMSFTTTYYSAYKNGLPADMFYQFMSEIKQDSSVANKGAVFNAKVKEFFEKH